MKKELKEVEDAIAVVLCKTPSEDDIDYAKHLHWLNGTPIPDFETQRQSALETAFTASINLSLAIAREKKN